MKRIFITSIILILSFTFSLNIAFAEKSDVKAGFKKQDNQVVTEVEPNDTFEDVNQTIHSLDEVQGTISEEDKDLYKIEMQRKGEFTLYSFLGNDESYDNHYYYDEYAITIYDVNGNTVASSDYFYDDESDYYYRYLNTKLEKGIYYISVNADEYSYIGSQPYYLWPEVLYDADFTIDSPTANLQSPQIERKTITFQTSASKTGLQYQYSIQNKIVKTFSTSNAYQWTPTAPGTYKIKVEVRDPAFPSAVVVKEISYTITAYKPDFAITSFAPNIKSPYLSGKTINLWAKTNKSGLQYQFSVNGKVVQSFGAKNYYSWKPTRSGRYNLKVEVRRSQYPNRIVTKQISYDITDGKVYVTSLKANMSSPRPTSTSIKWSAAGKGVNLEYKFSVYQNKKWKTIQNYSARNYTYWKPKSAGAAKVQVTVRSKLSKKTATKTGNFTIFKPSYFSTPTLKSDISTKQAAGTYFYFTAKSKGSYLEYRFRVYRYGYWYTVQDYSSNKSLYWAPYYDGDYKVAVDVRQKGTKKVKTKKLSLDIREQPSYYFSANYNIYYNNGYLYVNNRGYSNLKVTKVQQINNGKVIYSYSPKDWITTGQSWQTYYFYPKKPITSFGYYTYWKVYYTFDGLSYSTYLTK
ncbi:triple tyrosine motif-containing protein [Neobacillus sp. SuZ13]|uniref:triple tyrosine motif-containing protein n=1 Tax=Neobacillus sp. SuZ13 TaxID=3047875 RepID=UPI0024BF2C70|nr:triple tyrosine motif-containing protein [Neobacillus sp. SuZ13]WHY66374.1 triple tyrosine motif-containing protein [Neobacillus sp. SuZ13]